MKKNIFIIITIGMISCFSTNKTEELNFLQKCKSFLTSPRSFIFKNMIINNNSAILAYNSAISTSINRKLDIAGTQENVFASLTNEQKTKKGNKKIIIDALNPKPFIKKFKSGIEKISFFLNPVFSLLECTDPCNNCELGRWIYPEKRKAFEEYVCKNLAEIAKQKDFSKRNCVEYVSFGSGMLFQDLVIITKFLEKQPTARIHIYCIDPQYAAYKDIQNYLEKHKDKTIEQDLMEITRYLVKEEKNEEKIKEIAKILLLNYLQISTIEKQFLNFLKTAFPDSDIELWLFKENEQYFSFTRYIQRVTDYKISADIIVASDIYNEMDLWQKSEEHYIELCQEIKKENPTVKNVILHGQGLLSYNDEKIDFVTKF